jgi:hypothetical protein
MHRVITFFAVAFAMALATPRDVVQASQQGVLVMKNWKNSDKCAQQAQSAFPDFTPESNAKRDAKLKECLEGQRLAPRAPNAPGQ